MAIDINESLKARFFGLRKQFNLRSSYCTAKRINRRLFDSIDFRKALTMTDELNFPNLSLSRSKVSPGRDFNTGIELNNIDIGGKKSTNNGFI